MTAADRDRAIEESLLRPVFETGRTVWVTVGLLVAVIAFGGYQWLRQLQDGMVIAGMNQPVYWGLYITNYVFFIGISHAGTLISAILRLTHAEWRRPICGGNYGLRVAHGFEQCALASRPAGTHLHPAAVSATVVATYLGCGVHLGVSVGKYRISVSTAYS